MKLPIGKTVISVEGLNRIINSLKEAGYKDNEDVELTTFLCFYRKLNYGFNFKSTLGWNIKEKDAGAKAFDKLGEGRMFKGGVGTKPKSFPPPLTEGKTRASGTVKSRDFGPAPTKRPSGPKGQGK